MSYLIHDFHERGYRFLGKRPLDGHFQDWSDKWSQIEENRDITEGERKSLQKEVSLSFFPMCPI